MDPEYGPWRLTQDQNYDEVYYPVDDPRGHYGARGQMVNGTIDYNDYTLRLQWGAIYCFEEKAYPPGNTTCASPPAYIQKFCGYYGYWDCGIPLDGRCFRHKYEGNPGPPFASMSFRTLSGPYQEPSECRAECV